MAELIKNVEKGAILDFAGLVDYEEGGVASLTLSQRPECKMTLFAIDEGEGMSSHAASGDALVYVLEGTGRFVLEGKPHDLKAGQALVMPAGAPHSVEGVTPFKMLLVVVKEGK